jgi:hypothetical protein
MQVVPKEDLKIAAAEGKSTVFIFAQKTCPLYRKTVQRTLFSVNFSVFSKIIPLKYEQPVHNDIQDYLNILYQLHILCNSA